MQNNVSGPAFEKALEYRRQGKAADSAHVCRAVLVDDPKHVGAMQIIAEDFTAKCDYPAAVALLLRAVAKDPLEPSSYFNLGMALMAAGRTEEAIAALRRATFLDAGNLQYHRAFAGTLASDSKVDDAVAEYEWLLKRSPNADAEFEMAAVLLAAGRYMEGWPRYEARWAVSGISRDQGLEKPMWDGSDPLGKRILLHTEQGYGDSIQFVRYARLLADRGAFVQLLCPIGLKRLFERQCGIESIRIPGQSFSDFDVHCPLGSLPMLFNTELQTIPGTEPYLAPKPDRISAWTGIMKGVEELKVGLCWASKQSNTRLWYKSIPDELLSPLNSVSGVRFFSLQKGVTDPDAKPDVDLVDWTLRLNDFADTASLIQNLDLVVSVDTAVAHLAGAIGKPTWLLLAANADWRWLRNRSDSPWYPSMRLFRQARHCEWGTVIDEVVAELQSLVQKRVG